MSVRAVIVNGMGFGDEGKGTIVDSIVQRTRAHTVIRYNGGPQAGHNVVTNDGRHHTFAQFGAGTFRGARTFLSRFMCVAPLAAMREAEALSTLGVVNPLSLLSIDEHALIITPFHRAANRLRELLRDGSRHGSCGVGVGESMADLVFLGPDQSLFMGELRNRSKMAYKLERIQEAKRAELYAMARDLPDTKDVLHERMVLERVDAVDRTIELFESFASTVHTVGSGYLAHVMNTPGTVVFEGAQGVLLDEWYGFHPHTTWSTTTPKNAHTLLSEASFKGATTTIGVMRAYATRHGAGPFPTEDPAFQTTLFDPYNTTGAWQGGFRLGTYDSVLASYARAVSGKLDMIAVTNLDRVNPKSWQHARGYAVNERDRDLFNTNEEGIAVSIRLKDQLEDLHYQERLTVALNRATPIYQSIRGGADGVLQAISSSFNAPVGIISRGPMQRHKQFLPVATASLPNATLSLTAA